MKIQKSLRGNISIVVTWVLLRIKREAIGLIAQNRICNSKEHLDLQPYWIATNPGT